MHFFRGRLLCVAMLIALFSSGCFFYGGAATVNTQTRASGSGFFSAAERNGQWERGGPPPRVGEITDRPLYRKLKKTFSVSVLGASSGDYELSDIYLPRRYRIAAIREVGTSTEDGKTVHYYEVEFDPEKTP